MTALVGAQVPDAADGELRAAPPRQDAVDLRVALMVAVGSLILYLGIAPMVVGQWRDFAAWWSLAAVTLMVPAVVVPLLGEAAPPRALRTLLWGFPIATLALLATWTVARTGPDAGADVGPWAWQLEPTAVGFAALAWPPPVAIVYSQVSASTVLATLLAADGYASRPLVATYLVHLTNVAFVVLLIAIRRQLTTVRDSEEQAALAVARAERARADEVEHRHLATIVHDDVLAALTLAGRSTEPIAQPVADQARRARAMLLGGRVRTDDGRPGAPRSAAALVAGLQHRAAAAGALCFVGPCDGAEVPREVVDALLGAVDEALRNSLAHAAGHQPGRGVARVVEVRADGAEVQVTVRDDGVGFRPADVDARRLGVRRSILARMAALPGGHATVTSAPGAGTTVELTWRRP